jgi:hypothetical protein
MNKVKLNQANTRVNSHCESIYFKLFSSLRIYKNLYEYISIFIWKYAHNRTAAHCRPARQPHTAALPHTATHCRAPCWTATQCRK